MPRSALNVILVDIPIQAGPTANCAVTDTTATPLDLQTVSPVQMADTSMRPVATTSLTASPVARDVTAVKVATIVCVTVSVHQDAIPLPRRQLDRTITTVLPVTLADTETTVGRRVSARAIVHLDDTRRPRLQPALIRTTAGHVTLDDMALEAATQASVRATVSLDDTPPTFLLPDQQRLTASHVTLGGTETAVARPVSARVTVQLVDMPLTPLQPALQPSTASLARQGNSMSYWVHPAALTALLADTLSRLVAMKRPIALHVTLVATAFLAAAAASAQATVRRDDIPLASQQLGQGHRTAFRVMLAVMVLAVATPASAREIVR